MSDKNSLDVLKVQNEAKNKVKPGDKYYHYKTPDHHYTVLEIGLIEETLVPAVIYKNEEGIIWVRPLDSFLETVDIEGKTINRFTKANLTLQ
jgi:hypothetical protein